MVVATSNQCNYFPIVGNIGQYNQVYRSRDKDVYKLDKKNFIGHDAMLFSDNQFLQFQLKGTTEDSERFLPQKCRQQADKLAYNSNVI